MLLDAVYEEKLEGAEGREAELQYVTQHFEDLRRLRVAPLFAGLFAGLILIPPGRKSLLFMLSFLGGLVLVTAIWAVWLTRWYKATYGFIATLRTASETIPGTKWLTVVLILLYTVLMLVPRDLHTATSFLVQVMIFFIPVGTAAAPNSKWIRLRRALYGAAAVATTGFVAAACFFRPYGYAALYTVSASLPLLQLYDHWLLGRLLRPLKVEGRGE